MSMRLTGENAFSYGLLYTRATRNGGSGNDGNYQADTGRAP